jgi:uncharacterized protein YxeA
MTKILNAIIVVIMIALVATFIISAMSLQSRTDSILSTYSARREELAARQQQIQDMILSLNSTVQQEMGKQQALTNQITTLGNQINSSIVAAASAPIVTPTAPTAPTPAFKATTSPTVISRPAPRVVTRAS